jgi:DNA polymerase V
MGAPSFALADCNNFYASCEVVFRPGLKDKPLVVAGNNDGNIIARSAAAKALGIPMGEAAYKVRELLQKNGGQICSANFPLYADMSCRVMDVLARFTPQLEVYSIDEAFLDLAAVPPASRHRYAADIRQTARQWTGLTVSIGVAPTKTLAKLAADEAKTATDGVHVLGDQVERTALLMRSDVGDVWGIGPARAKFLQKHGISTALDLSRADTGWLRRNLSVVVARTALELRGVSCLPLDQVREAKKQICTSRSFGHEVTSLDDLREAVATYASSDATKARGQHTLAKALTVFINTNPFREDLPQFSRSITIKLARATADTFEIVRAAVSALERIYQDGFSYHKAGVILGEFVDDTVQQAQLFEEPPDPRREELLRVMDEINARYGHEAIRLAATGGKRDWRMKQGNRSSRFTTQWKELPKVY